MPWLSFSKDFNFRPAVHFNTVAIKYRAGKSYLVTNECAAQALKARAATRIEREFQPSTREEIERAVKEGEE